MVMMMMMLIIHTYIARACVCAFYRTRTPLSAPTTLALLCRVTCACVSASVEQRLPCPEMGILFLFRSLYGITPR
uniref:Putative secreted protein n=1 Tax=Anopheles marajoara TaxID=58244 RepID=A0A2M4CD34_9DIPT